MKLPTHERALAAVPNNAEWSDRSREAHLAITAIASAIHAFQFCMPASRRKIAAWGTLLAKCVAG
jgi:hypothetical protein